MQPNNYFSMTCVFGVAVLSAFYLHPANAFGPITLTLGTTAVVLTGTQVAIGVAALAGLAIAKEKIVIADLARRNRGKREIESENFGPLFEAMYQADTTDCAKLLVCHVFEKPEEKLNGYELKVNRLFADDLSVIDPTTVKAEYQLAAYVGSFNRTGLCMRRYSRCTISVQDLSDLLQQS